jgi:uncharacterized protein YndB with AHSA1/START domain
VTAAGNHFRQPCSGAIVSPRPRNGSVAKFFDIEPCGMPKVCPQEAKPKEVRHGQQRAGDDAVRSRDRADTHLRRAARAGLGGGDEARARAPGYGCAAFTFTACEIDLRIGGSYRFAMRTPDGVDHTMTGTYREIVVPERVVHTERYETTGFTSPDALVTMTLTEQAGRTRLQSVILHPNRESRDGHLDSGMENGVRETFDRLAALLATIS